MTTEQTPKPQSKVEKFLVDIEKALEEKNKNAIKNAMFKAVTDMVGIDATEKAIEYKQCYAQISAIMKLKSAQVIGTFKAYGCGKKNVAGKSKENQISDAQDCVTVALYEYNKAGFGGRDEFLADMTEHIKTEKMKTEKMNQLAQIRRHAQCARS